MLKDMIVYSGLLVGMKRPILSDRRAAVARSVNLRGTRQRSCPVEYSV